MSSGTRQVSGAPRKLINGIVDQANDRIARLGMSPRQQRLNYYYSHYRGQCYDARSIDWDGTPHMDQIDREAIARSTTIPPGFYDAGALWPLKFRRPSAPYGLCKVVVDRFTGLLFSERRHPQLRVAGDSDTEDYAQALADAARLWPAMIQARSFGGSCGSVAVGFQFVEGRPIVEPHDPRWVFPQFSDRASLKLKAIEKRYIYPEDVIDPETGRWVEQSYWYRRILDEERDILWKPIPVGDGDEPNWGDPNLIASEVEHGLGFCPVVWVQNVPIADDVDGDPDCHCIYELVEAIDALVSQANRGIISSCDPTLVLAGPGTESAGDVKKGSDNAIVGPQGFTAQYLEIAGSGPKAALELADDLRRKALEVAQVVLEHPENGQRTATEVERAYSSMIAKADVLREQYGERCIKPLMEMMIEAARKVASPKRTGDRIERGSVKLPNRIEQRDGEAARMARKLGPGGELKLQWPGYFEPRLEDAAIAVQAAAGARAARLVDREHASKFVADHFRVDDVRAMLKELEAEEKSRQSDFEQSSMDRMQGIARPPALPEDGDE